MTGMLLFASVQIIYNIEDFICVHWIHCFVADDFFTSIVT